MGFNRQEAVAAAHARADSLSPSIRSARLPPAAAHARSAKLSPERRAAIARAAGQASARRRKVLAASKPPADPAAAVSK